MNDKVFTLKMELNRIFILVHQYSITIKCLVYAMTS